jgi:hydroxyethylthiazole kinase-like uncharacterized protein yjeF
VRTYSERLPRRVFSAAQVRELDRRAIATGIPGYELMCRAGAAALRTLRARWPAARRLAVVCGGGNNGGDGLVVARLAREAGLEVRVLSLVDVARLKGEAAQAAADCTEAGLVLEPFMAAPLATADVLVDALLGTGISRALSAEFRVAVEAINAAGPPVLALDIPSGLDADTGLPCDIAVRASVTITFVGLKQGLFLGGAADHCGLVEFASLDLPESLGADLQPPLERLVFDELREALPRRARSAHKGSAGRLLLVGGGPGMPGAIRLAAEAALRAGAGLVYVATHPDNLLPVLGGRPEIIARAVRSARDFEDLLASADGIVLGPGLGRSAWAYQIWQGVIEADRPLILDADGINWLVDEPRARGQWVLTPHPAEAARLLASGTAADVQRDRHGAVLALAHRWGATVVLKGAHTLVAANGAEAVAVCDHGNPGMATGGTGDVLAGVIGALLVQTGHLEHSARAGVLLHALAGDAAAAAGERGMVAGDLLPELRAWANPN